MRNQKACHQAWSFENGNKDGDCCCNCEWQRPLMKQPSNEKYSFGYGSIMQQMAWVCMIPEPDFYPGVFFMDHEHGMCEMHTPRDYSKYPASYTMRALQSVA